MLISFSPTRPRPMRCGARCRWNARGPAPAGQIRAFEWRPVRLARSSARGATAAWLCRTVHSEWPWQCRCTGCRIHSLIVTYGFISVLLRSRQRMTRSALLNGLESADDDTLGGLLLRATVIENANGIVLMQSRSISRIEHNVRAAPMPPLISCQAAGRCRAAKGDSTVRDCARRVCAELVVDLCIVGAGAAGLALRDNSSTRRGESSCSSRACASRTRVGTI